MFPHDCINSRRADICVLLCINMHQAALNSRCSINTGGWVAGREEGGRCELFQYLNYRQSKVLYLCFMVETEASEMKGPAKITW